MRADTSAVLVHPGAGDIAGAEYLHMLSIGFRLNFSDVAVEVNFHTIAGQSVGHHLRGVAFLLWQEQRFAVHHDRACAKARESLGNFTAQWPAADDQEAGRQGRHFKNRLVV